jgi:sporulation integral membrane protein YtvI
MYALYKKYARTALDIALIALSVFLIYLTFSYVYAIATPIFFGLVIYAIIEPLAAFLHRRGMKKPTASLISVLVFIVIIASLLVLAGMIFTFQIKELSTTIVSYESVIKQAIDENYKWLTDKYDALQLPPELFSQAQEYLKKLTAVALEYLNVFLLGLFQFVKSVPTLLFNFIAGLILAFYLSAEIDLWRKWSREKVPNTIKKAFAFLRDNVLSGIARYLKAQLILISITFSCVFVGLLLLGINNAFSIAVIAALFDILPILGIPVIFVPWIIYLLVAGKVELAIWLGVVFAVTFITRQVLEPKISGDSLGVSPFTMLACLLVSLSLFGVAGVILTPFLVILIKALYDHGYFKKWIHVPADEFEPRP